MSRVLRLIRRAVPAGLRRRAVPAGLQELDAATAELAKPPTEADDYAARLPCCGNCQQLMVGAKLCGGCKRVCYYRWLPIGTLPVHYGGPPRIGRSSGVLCVL